LYSHAMGRGQQGQGGETAAPMTRRGGGILSVKENALLGRLASHHAYTAAHSRRVAALAAQTAQQLGLPAQQQREVEHCGLLHDVGKIAVPVSILDGSGKPSDEEWRILQSHSNAGDELTTEAGTAPATAQGVRGVHERIDGGGYPDGLSGDSIPLAAQIVAVCDAYDAMTAPGRNYHKHVSSEEGCKRLREESGTHFSPVVVEAFCQTVSRA